MRVLIVSWTKNLLMNLAALNPGLEVSAIITDEVEVARKFLEPIDFPPNLIYPLCDLKDCVKDFYYDYIICAENPWKNDFGDVLTAYDVPKEKIISFNASPGNFMIERSLRYFKEHAAEFDMFATGISYTQDGLDVTRFKRKLFNFARSSQDLYYNFQTAKFALSCSPPGKISHALIGLSIYAFHYDLSKTSRYRFQMLYYLIAHNDLHNFYIPIDEYRKFFNEEFLAARLPLESFDVNNPFGVKKARLMKPEDRLKLLQAAKSWAHKYCPETRDENIKILDDYLTFCEENSIRPIMFVVPVTEGYYIKHFNKRSREEFLYLVGAACRKHPGAVFLDGWELRGLTDADFYECTHLNVMGAAKFSAFLNDFIERLE